MNLSLLAWSSIGIYILSVILAFVATIIDMIRYEYDVKQIEQKMLRI